jgi:outer membrane receptor protein involved in Fe transport
VRRTTFIVLLSIQRNRGLAASATVLLLLLVRPGLLAARSSLSHHGLRSLGLDPRESAFLLAATLRALADQSLIGPRGEVAARCKADRRCHCAEARRVGADRAFYGQLGRIGELYTFELVVIDVHSCAVERAAFVSEEHSVESAGRRLAELVSEVATPPSEVSETAVKRERPIDRVPAPVTVMTRAELRELDLREIQEVVELVPGFESLEANWGSLVLHGGLPNTILYSIDGVPLYDAQVNVRVIGRDLRLHLGHFERVELVRGPGSVLWGPNALLGIVNFATRAPHSRELELGVEARLASPRTAEAFAHASQKRGPVGYSVSAAVSRDPGQISAVDESPFGAVLLTDAVWGNAGETAPRPDRYADLFARVDAWDRLHLSLAHIQFRTWFEISPFGSLLDASEPGYWDDRLRVYSAAWQDLITRCVGYRFSVSRYEKLSNENFVVHPEHPDGHPDGLRSVQGHPTDPRTSHLGEARLTAESQLGPAVSSALVGVTWLHQRVPDSLATITTLDGEVGEPAVSFTGKRFDTLAAFVHESLRLGENAILSAGARYEHRDPLPSGLTTQGGLVLTSSRLTGKLLFAEGFRPPEALNLYSTVGTQGNPELEPEDSRSFSGEIAVEATEGVRARIGASMTYLDELIVLDPDQADPGFAYKPVNAGSIEVASAYSEASVEISRVRGFANFTGKRLTQSEELVDRIPVAPWTAAGGISAWIATDLRAWGRGAVMARREVRTYLPSEEPAPLTVGERTLPVNLRYAFGFSLANLPHGFEVDVAVENAFGPARHTPYQVDGRPSFLVERRTGTEASLTLRWSP